MKAGGIIKRTWKGLGWAFLLLVILVAALFIAGPTLPLDFLAPRLEQALSGVLGQPVKLSGLRCTVALQPTLSLDQFHVKGGGGSNLVSATALRLTTSIPDLLAKTLRIEDALVEEVELCFPGPTKSGLPPAEAGDATPAEASSAGRPRLDLVDLSARRVQIRCRIGEREEVVDLSAMAFAAPLVGSTRLTFHTVWRKQQADVEVVGGNLNTLMGGPLLWPLRVEVTSDHGTLAASALARGSPFPADAETEMTAILRDVHLDHVLHEATELAVGLAMIRARWRGITPADLLASIDVVALVDDVRVAAKEQPDGKDLEAYLRNGLASWRPGRPIVFNGDGDLLGEVVHLDADVGPITTWPPEEDLPFQLRAEGAGAMLHAGGAWGHEADGRSLRVEADVRGDRVGDLAPWFGISPEAALPYHVAATFHRRPKHTGLLLEQAYLGSTRLSGSAERVTDGAGRITREVKLTFDLLDFDELARLGNGDQGLKVKPAGPAEADAPRLRVDIPVLPSNLRLPDVDLLLAVSRLQVAGASLDKIETHLKIRDGWMERAPFSLQAAAAQWTGEFLLDAREAIPLLGVELRANNVAVDEMFPVLSEDPDLSIRAGHVFMDADVEGTTVRQMMSRYTLSLKAEDVHVQLPRHEDLDPLDIGISALNISRLEQDENLLVEAELTVGGKAAGLRSQLGLVEGDAASALPRLHYDGTLRCDTTEVTMAGVLTLPLRDVGLDLDVHVKTEEPAWVTDLVDLGWKPLAPLDVTCRISGSKDRYHIADLDVKLNRSRLVGRGTIDGTGECIVWGIDGQCPTLWIDDLGMEPGTNDVAAAAEGEQEEDEEDADSGRPVKGGLALRVEEAFYKGTALGGGSFGLSIEPGRLVINPLRAQNDERFAHLAFEHNVPLEGGTTNHYHIGVTATNLPINLLGLMSPQFSRSLGNLYADVDLASGVPEDDPRFTAYLNGELGLAVFPENIRSRFLDYWAVGAIQALGMTLVGHGNSRVECIAGRLQFKDGVVRPQQVYIDTARIRVNCTGSVDFNTGKLDLKLKPRPKRRAFISLATPVVVKGTFDDPDIRLSKGALGGMFLRIYFWFVTAFDSLFHKNIPEHDFDGYMRMMSGEKP